MAVQITSDNFEQYFSEYFENYFLNTYSEHSSALENDEGEARGADVIVDQAGMDATLALPGVRYDKPVVVGGQVNNKAKAEAYVQIPWAVLIQALNILQSDAEVIMLDWNGDGTEEHPGLKTQVNAAIVGAERVTASLSGSTLTVVDRNGTPYSVNTAAASEAAAAEWTNTYKPDIIAKTSAAQTATTGAERVNAQLDGMTVTITNRQGVSKSTNIGFEVYRTYSSVAAMNADAANVPQGKFVIIATTDATDPDNAKLYAKNSQGGFTFLSDLDQASSAAWADWLDNMKPQIESATTYANQQGDYAKAQGTNANSIWETVKTWFNGTLGNNGFKNTAETWLTTTQTTWNNWFSDTLATGVRKIWNTWFAKTQNDYAAAEGTENGSTAGDGSRWGAYKQAEDNRNQAYIDAEDERMATMTLTHPFVDPATMCLMFVQPQQDKTKYQVLQGCLNITIQYKQQ